MTQRRAPEPSRVAAQRIKRERQRQGITAARLAERCDELGMPSLNRDVIANIETARRGAITVDELLVLGAALNTSPLLLMLPLGTDQRLAVTPTTKIHPHLALEWLVGEGPLVDTDHTARVSPWPDENTPSWVEAAQPLWFYRRLRELQDEVSRTMPAVGQTWRDDAQREDVRAALNRLAEHVEYMRHAGLDETRVVADYEKHLTEIKEG